VAFHDEQGWWAGQGANHYLESRGPWWVDANHSWSPEQKTPGFGFANIIAFRQLHPTADLRGATVRFRLKTAALRLRLVAAGDGTPKTRRGHLYFFFETSPLHEGPAGTCGEQPFGAAPVGRERALLRK
jgi:hypothetical protein